MIKQLAATIALALPMSALALSNSFSYQGSLNDGGSPATGSYDLQFQLQTSAGGNVGAPLVREDVAVSGGLFAVELDFGAAISSGDFRLQIGVRPGASTGAYTTLSPTTNIRPTPQAQVAGIASEAVTVSPDSISSASIQSGAVTTSEIADNTVLSADIADGTIGAVDVDINEVQWRVSTACSPGQAIRSIAANGAVTCENTVGGGTVTSIATGTGLTGGPITASGTISIATGGVTSALIADGTVASVDIADGSISAFDLAASSVNGSKIEDGTVGLDDIDTAQVQHRVFATCPAGSSIREVLATGGVTCETDDGTVTSVASGAGLSGGPITSSGTLSIATGGVTSTMIADGTVANADLAANSVNAGNIVDGSVGSADVNTAQVQARVTGTCAAGSSINAIAANGMVSCETDDVGPAGWSLTGNNGTNPATQFIGTTDNQALVLRVNNSRSLRIEPNNVSPNLIGGVTENVVTTGAYGAAIGGGGQFNFPNRVTDNYGAIGGGAGNVAGDGLGTTSDQGFATVSGGQLNTASAGSSAVGGGLQNTAAGSMSTVGGGNLNTASGNFSTVSGGSDNTASGENSAVGGGSFNCAGGRWSWAGGASAKVRPGSASGGVGSGCNGVPGTGTAGGDQGTFAWSDSQGGALTSSGPNQFLVRADGGVMFNTSTLPFSGDDLVVRARQNSGDADSDLTLVTRGDRRVRFYASNNTGSLVITPNNLATASDNRLVVEGGSGGNATLSNGGTWTNASSRTFKAGFQAVDTLDVLARVVDLPISTWNYIGSAEGLHMGPVAEDFKRAFGLAGDGKSIATVDADGVALAAIQGLNQKLEAENAALRAELAELRALVMERVR